MSEDWHKDTPEPRHWLFYVAIKVGIPVRFLGGRAQLWVCVSEMTKERLYLFDATLRARSRAGAMRRARTNRKDAVAQAAGKRV